MNESFKNLLRLIRVMLFIVPLYIVFGTSSTGEAAIPTTFRARVTLALCPEYPFGDVGIEIKYMVGSDPQVINLTILSQSIDTQRNVGTFEVDLPTGFGTTPLNVFAHCTNSFGSSQASNSRAITNCDNLALQDTDNDGLANNIEDTNCDNFFSFTDQSNSNHFDTDGDGLYDLVELLSGTDRVNAGSSPRPWVFAGAPFDPDGDGDSNPVAWRVSSGTWFVKDFVLPGQHISFQYGLPGDTPIVYDPDGFTTNVGVIRNVDNLYFWFLRGAGFLKSDGSRENLIPFGLKGDHIILGPWEKPGVTNPAVARLVNGFWFFYIYMSDGTFRQQVWGQGLDVPKVQDYDGDGIFDFAVYRPSEQKTYVIRSSDLNVEVLNFGTGSSDYTFRGDITGDGKDDLTFWEPVTGIFNTLLSDSGFDDVKARSGDPIFAQTTQLGLYFIHLPMSWNMQKGKVLYTVVDHAAGLRYFREDNELSNPIQWTQWGLPGDSLG